MVGQVAVLTVDGYEEAWPYQVQHRLQVTRRRVA